MTDIVLNPIVSDDRLALINTNFSVVEDAINNGVLNLVGGNNVMGQDIDLNGYNILNLDTGDQPNGLVTNASLLGEVSARGQADQGLQASIEDLYTKLTSVITGGSDANPDLPYINIGGNAATATKLLVPRTITLTGHATGSTTFDGSGNVTINTTLVPGTIATSDVSGLDASLAAKAPTASPAFTGVVYAPLYTGPVFGSTTSTSVWYATSGTLYMRPNGPASSVGQATLNSAGTMTIGGVRVPKIFVQSGDPGAAASDGDLWVW